MLDKYDPEKNTITHFCAQNIRYRKAAEELDCSKDTILNRMKTLHQHDETHLELTENIDAILTEASNNEQFLTCKIIKNKLRINFNYEISLKKHYIEMRNLQVTNIQLLFLSYKIITKNLELIMLD